MSSDQANPRTPVQVAARYAELFNAGKYGEMGGLFAADAVWRRPPPAPEVRGRDLIIAGYASAEMSQNVVSMRITSERFIVDGSTVAAEFVFTRDAHTSHVIDVFEIDAMGYIASMTVFTR